MKTYKKNPVSKLLAKYDNELKNLLMADLKALKTKSQFLNNMKTSSLSAA